MNVAQHVAGGSGDLLHKQGDGASVSALTNGLHNGAALHNMAKIDPSLLISKEEDVSIGPASHPLSHTRSQPVQFLV